MATARRAPPTRVRVGLWLLGCLIGLLPFQAKAADTVTTFPAFTDTFVSTLAPYLVNAGDNVSGSRTIPDNQVKAVSYDFRINTLTVFCPNSDSPNDKIQLAFSLDGTTVATFTLTPFLEENRFTAVGIPITKSGSTHTLKLERVTAFIDDCGSPAATVDVSKVTLHSELVPIVDVDGDGSSPPADCNDNDATINPSATEVCDSKDNDCDGQSDEGLTFSTWYLDADGDGYGTNTSTTSACAKPVGYAAVGGDCKDNDPGVNPGRTEVCDGKDNDCDAQVDEGVKPTWYKDVDLDGYGGTSTVASCTKPTGYVAAGGDCNDANNAINPGATEICDGIDQDCDGVVDDGATTTYYLDADADTYGGGTTTQACTKPSGYVTVGGDCNDANAAIKPGATEVCDGVDQDCDGSIDEGTGTTTYYRDNDGDTYGNPNNSTTSCSQPSGYVTNNTDCNDNNAAIKPGATETCDGVDNNCNGQTDEGASTIWYKDNDGDGYGVSTNTTNACTRPTGYAPQAGDCDDTKANVNPGATEACDGIDNDCDTQIDENVKTTYYQDSDADGYGVSTTTTQACSKPSGYASQSGDCDDTKGNVNPGATETCDGVDNDCDTQIDENLKVTYYKDNDNDGYGQTASTTQACSKPTGYATQSGDCDDTKATVNPGATETCDGIDNDCDTQIDENLKTTWYQDSDNDGYGVSTTTQQACTKPTGYASQSGDCDDTKNDVYPGAIEACDGKDNDCDGQVDENGVTSWYKDNDGDGYGVASQSQQACTKPAGYAAASGDCDDTKSGVNPGATEVCDGIDNDCDAQVDENLVTTWYKDSDGDGYGLTNTTTQSCTKPSGYATVGGDCNDTKATVYPSAPELCDGIDNDCDGQSDEGLKATYYEDTDGDGYGQTGSTVQSCSKPAGYASVGGDCNDTLASVNPGQLEVCDGVDNDCDGQSDEGLKATYYPDSDSDGYGSSTGATQACAAPAGYVSNNSDCNDKDALVKPGAEEICNQVDDDCDGTVDEGLTSTWYEDGDNDGFGDAASPVDGCTQPSGTSTLDTDCDDEQSSVFPGANEACGDGIDQDCNNQDLSCDGEDRDGDGYAPIDGDCNDQDGAVNPGAEEIPYDDIDNDCEGTDLIDVDGDGFDAAIKGGEDCDDNNAAIHPDAEEVCDNVDNNCDANTDDVDADNDGAVALACQGLDCDDTLDNVGPDAVEVADGLDNNCNGIVDDVPEVTPDPPSPTPVPDTPTDVISPPDTATPTEPASPTQPVGGTDDESPTVTPATPTPDPVTDNPSEPPPTDAPVTDSPAAGTPTPDASGTPGGGDPDDCGCTQDGSRSGSPTGVVMAAALLLWRLRRRQVR